MKTKWIIATITLLLCVPALGQKISTLTELTIPDFNDILWITHDPCGTPESNKIKIGTLREHFNVKDFGADANGVTDDTKAIQSAINAAQAAGGGTVFLPAGTYRLADALVFNATYAYGGATNGSVNLRGASRVATVLQRDIADANQFCIEITGGTGWEQAMWVIEEITFDGGVGRDTSGIYMSASDRGGLLVRNCAFWRTDVGFKNVGALDWRLENCAFDRGNVGIWIERLPTMHGGCGLIDGRWNISYTKQAGVYIHAEPSNIEQVEFHHGVFEANAGFAIFVEHWNESWPLIFNDCYFELNGTAASTVVDSNTYDDPEALYVRDSRNVHFNSCKLTQGTSNTNGGDIIDSQVYTEFGYYYNDGGDFNDVNSVIYSRTPCVTGVKVYDGNTIAVDGFTAKGEIGISNNKVTMRVQMRPFVVDYAADNLWPRGSMQTAFTPTNVNGLTYSFVQGDAPQWGPYMEITLPAGATYSDGMRLWDNFAEVAGASYVWSFDVRTEVSDANVCFYSTGGSGNFINCTSLVGLQAVPWEWRRFYGMGRSGYTQSAQDLYIYQKGGVETVVQIANVQLVKVRDYTEAIRYIREQRFAASNLVLDGTRTHDYAGAATAWTLTADESRNATRLIVSNANGAVDVIWPSAIPGRMYTIDNNTNQTVTVKVTGQTGHTVAASKEAIGQHSATDCVEIYEQP